MNRRSGLGRLPLSFVSLASGPLCRLPPNSAHSHHLEKAKQILGPLLLTWHNLTYVQDLMAEIREAIGEGRLTGAAARLRARWAAGEALRKPTEAGERPEGDPPRFASGQAQLSALRRKRLPPTHGWRGGRGRRTGPCQ